MKLFRVDPKIVLVRMLVEQDGVPSYATREAMVRSLEYNIPNIPDNAERRARILGSFVWSANTRAKFIAADGESDASVYARKIKIVKYLFGTGQALSRVTSGSSVK